MTELFPEPLRHELSRSQMDRILLWCVEKRASDIVFCPGDPVWMEQDGVWRRVTDAGLTPSETERIVNETTMQASRAGYVRSGRSTDYAYQTRVPESRGVWQRFRVNATSTPRRRHPHGPLRGSSGAPDPHARGSHRVRLHGRGRQPA